MSLMDAMVVAVTVGTFSYSFSMQEPQRIGSPEGHWIGNFNCAETIINCSDQRVDVTISSTGTPQLYDMKIVKSGHPDKSMTLSLELKPEKRVLTAHQGEGNRREFWALRFEGNTLSGVQMVNASYIDHAISLTRTIEP